MSSGSKRVGRGLAISLLTVVSTVAIIIAVALSGRGGEGGEEQVPRARQMDPQRSLVSQAKAVPTTQRCLDSLFTVEQAGLELRDETEFRCPGIAAEPGEEHHWGATCWENELCPGGSYIAVDADLIGPDDARLRYVIAHEICHVNSYVATGDRGSEAAADQCAAAAGFPKR